MKISKMLSSLITNKYVLYIVATLAFINIFGYAMARNINAVAFFILIGYVMTFFTKNMIIVLLVPMFFTNSLMIGMKVKETFVSSSSDTSASNKKKNDTPIILPHHDDLDQQDESFKTRDEPLEYEEIKEKKKHSKTRLDHSATVENAYDTLNKIIGSPGFTKMTDDTKRLMEQQQKLAQSMEQFGPMLDSITPFLEKAQGLLGNIDINGISSMANVGKNTN